MNAIGLPTALVVAMCVSAAVMILAPLVAVLVARRRLEAGWRHVGLGALTFFVFQLATRIPLVALAGVWLQEPLADSAALQWGWLGVLAFSAGLFEETGRYVCFRWLMRNEDKTWDRAVMVGLGHGGLESMLLVGGGLVVTLVVLLAMPAEALDLMPPEAREQIQAIVEQPGWLPLLGGAERLMSMVFHVALSVLVAQVFLRGGLRWLVLAIVAHGLGNALVVGVMKLAGGEGDAVAALAAEGAMLLVTAAAVAWLVGTGRRQRAPSTQSTVAAVD